MVRESISIDCPPINTGP